MDHFRLASETPFQLRFFWWVECGPMLYACLHAGHWVCMVESPASHKTMTTVAQVANYSFKCVQSTYIATYDCNALIVFPFLSTGLDKYNFGV